MLFVGTHKGIKIRVKVKYLERNASEGLHYFKYHIEITNQNDFDVQLVQRHWNIFDSIQGVRKVTGEGVVGLTPTIKSNEMFNYESYCPLQSAIGSMDGYYQFKHIENGELFSVKIPLFELIFPGVLN